MRSTRSSVGVLLQSLGIQIATKDRLFNNWPDRNPETPYTAGLLEDPRIYVPSEQLVGEDSVPVHSNANSYPASTAWHPDNKDHRLLMIKNVVYLQPTTPEHGALRLIPGSHRNPLHKDLPRIGLDGASRTESSWPKESGLRGEDISCFIFSSNPGDVVTFDSLIWHAAFGGFNDRRTCTFNFYRNPSTPEEKESMRKEMDGTRAFTKSLGTVGPQYHEWWLENPAGGSRRARWINWLEEWGFVEAYNG